MSDENAIQVTATKDGWVSVVMKDPAQSSICISPGHARQIAIQLLLVSEEGRKTDLRVRADRKRRDRRSGG